MPPAHNPKDATELVNLHRELAPLLLALRGQESNQPRNRPRRTGSASPGGPAPDLSARLQLHRGAILGLLARGTPRARTDGDDAEYIHAERLGVADELGMPTRPESAAWLVAVGESIECNCTKRTNGVE